MAISAKMQKAFNDQINAEFYSAYLYLAMSCQADDLQLKGVANWFYIQYQEEIAHGMGLLNYLQEWPDVVAMYEQTCEHEAHVTSLINNLKSLADEEKDYAASHFLDWYVKEQVEEEATAAELLGEFKMAKDNPSATLLLTSELSARVFNAPVIG